MRTRHLCHSRVHVTLSLFLDVDCWADGCGFGFKSCIRDRSAGSHSGVLTTLRILDSLFGSYTKCEDLLFYILL